MSKFRSNKLKNKSNNERCLLQHTKQIRTLSEYFHYLNQIVGLPIMLYVITLHYWLRNYAHTKQCHISAAIFITNNTCAIGAKPQEYTIPVTSTTNTTNICS
jgi:hypothetical protein